MAKFKSINQLEKELDAAVAAKDADACEAIAKEVYELMHLYTQVPLLSGSQLKQRAKAEAARLRAEAPTETMTGGGDLEAPAVEVEGGDDNGED